MNEKKSVLLSSEEVAAVVEVIDEISGGNPENVFAWDGTDDVGDPATRAFALLYLAAGREGDVPEKVRREIHL